MYVPLPLRVYRTPNTVAAAGHVKRQFRHRDVTHVCASLCWNGCMKNGKPTVRQVYALAAVLCERAGEEFPETREAASELIERLRIESGHHAPRLEDVPVRRRGRWARAEVAESRVASELVREMR